MSDEIEKRVNPFSVAIEIACQELPTNERQAKLVNRLQLFRDGWEAAQSIDSAESARKERTRIVAWLRRHVAETKCYALSDRIIADAFAALADDIEAGRCAP